jgi:hypothetical protein
MLKYISLLPLTYSSLTIALITRSLIKHPTSKTQKKENKKKKNPFLGFRVLEFFTSPCSPSSRESLARWGIL